jgi:hypothetical protein
MALLAAVATVVLAVAAAPAAAGPAVITSSEYCDTFSDYEFCSTWRSVSQFVVTPSDNLMWNYHSRSDYTVTYVPTGEVIQTGSNRWHDHGLTKKGESHVISSSSVGEFSFGNVTCSSRFTLHYANGEVRHENQEFNCS